MQNDQAIVRWFDELNNEDVDKVGGKNASLGEMIGNLKEQGIQVPDGFATTAQAYRDFLSANDLNDRIETELDQLSENPDRLSKTGRNIRRLFIKARFSDAVADAVRGAYEALCEKYQSDEVDVAVRSSATAEDLPEASFAGQQETFLNLTGADELLEACRECYASLFTYRAISYRREKGFDHMQVALSVGIQKMVYAEDGRGTTRNVETTKKERRRFVLSDDEVLQLARW